MKEQAPRSYESFSLMALRDVVRPVSPKLAQEITLACRYR